ncbi:MAG: PKD domain-containing protein, partial [Chitinophagales bacterium]
FGDGHTSDQQNPSHTYDHEGTYHVCLTITDIHEICTSTYCHDVTVHFPSDSCHASFTFHTDSTGNGIQFTNTSTGTTAHTVYDWTFGDGTSSADEDPFHHYNHSGHHTVCLYITDTTTGCTSHTCHTIYHHSEFHIADHNEDLTIALPAGMANEGINLFAYPNPFSDAFTVNYELANPAEVKIEFFDLAGRIIMSLQNHFEEAGAHTQFFSEDNLSFGVYFLKLSVDQNFYVIKIAVQKQD